jgi:starch synthase
MVASEVAPFAKTGGLADVVGSLPAALDALGHDVTVVTPRYRRVPIDGTAPHRRRIWLGRAAHDVELHTRPLSERRRVMLLDYPAFYDRDDLYGSGGRDFDDNAERFALLAVAALDVGQAAAAGAPRPTLIHAHDWQAGLALSWLRHDPRRWPDLVSAGTVQTIHNLAYQGLFPREIVPRLGLPWEVLAIEAGEFWGQFSFLKAGITAADVITTVSPTYARETLTPPFGAGLDGVLRSRADRYVGILNGIDTAIWNPAADRFLPANYDAQDLAGKAVCKRALLERFALPIGDDALARPIIGLVSRLVEQKGLDLIEAAAEALIATSASFIFVGTGDRRYEELLRRLAVRHPSRVGTFIGFDEPLAHLVEAGADMFLMPSKFEPCGLNQMYSLRYGTVPIVHAVGGLEDTIQPYTSRALRANGFKFHGNSAEDLARVVKQAVRLFADQPTWRRLMINGMGDDHSWRQSAREYVKVYRRARVEGAQRGSPAAGA